MNIDAVLRITSGIDHLQFNFFLTFPHLDPLHHAVLQTRLFPTAAVTAAQATSALGERSGCERPLARRPEVGVVHTTAGRVLPLFASRRVVGRATPRPTPTSASSREHLPTAGTVTDHLPRQVRNADFPAHFSFTPSRGANVCCLVRILLGGL